VARHVMLRGVVAFGPYWRGGAQKSTAPFGSGPDAARARPAIRRTW